MTIRASSIYTAHFDTPAAAARFADALTVPIQDHGHTSVSFRAPDDEAARKIAFHATYRRTRDYTLSTGLGVHRREVDA